MPIRPENKKLYPSNWKEISYYVRFVLYGGYCSFCPAKHGEPHPETKAKVILTCMHLDHNPGNCELSNLRSGCQKCHNTYDRQHRNRSMKENKNKNNLKLNL